MSVSMQDFSGTPRRELHVFYVLDTSGSMAGLPIATLNSTMMETIDELKDQAKHNADALVKIAVLEFNSGCSWMTSNGPEELEKDFIWQSRTAGGLTDMGAALKELNAKLSRHAFLSSMTGAYVPVIIFFTDGMATDNYKNALEEIRQNRWFQNARKIGFALGENADEAMIAEIVGNSEAVIKPDDLEQFSKMLKFVSVTTTMLASQSQTTNNDINMADIARAAKNGGDMPLTPEPKPKPEPDTDTAPDTFVIDDNDLSWDWGDDFD